MKRFRNKSDRPEKKRAVSKAEGEAFARKHKMQFIEISAKTNHNLDKMFELMAVLIGSARFLRNPNQPAKNKETEKEKCKVM